MLRKERAPIDRKQPYLISACLMGKPCRYDGNTASVRLSPKLLEEIEVIPICPECLGGLPIPRPPAEIVGGDGERVLLGTAKVVDREDRDRTDAFLLGAAKVLEMAENRRVSGAILKARSPSCGKGRIYDGSFKKNLIEGDGVAVALLKRHGIGVWTEEEWLDSHQS